MTCQILLFKLLNLEANQNYLHNFALLTFKTFKKQNDLHEKHFFTYKNLKKQKYLHELRKGGGNGGCRDGGMGGGGKMQMEGWRDCRDWRGHSKRSWQSLMMTRDDDDTDGPMTKDHDTKTWSSFIKLSNPLSSPSSFPISLHPAWSFIISFPSYPFSSCLILHYIASSCIISRFPWSSVLILYHPFIYFIILFSLIINSYTFSSSLLPQSLFFTSHHFSSFLIRSYPVSAFLIRTRPILPFIIPPYPLPPFLPHESSSLILCHPPLTFVSFLILSYPFSSCLFLLFDNSKPFLVSIYRPF